MRATRLLNGSEWWVGHSAPGQSVPPGDWLPAEAPGDVRLDLMRAGLIPDPFYADNTRHCEWVDEKKWWLKREFDAPEKPGRAFLRFCGLDYHSEVFLNGKRLGEHVGMFAHAVFEVTGLLKERNELIAAFRPPTDYPDRLKTLKCQMSYGWDFAPRIRNVGIWDDVELVRTGRFFIRRMSVHPRADDGEWLVDAAVEIDAAVDTPGVVEFDVEGANFAMTPVVQREMVHLVRGRRVYRTAIRIEEPRLWSPWEEGPQNLYRIRATVDVGKRLEDVEEARFGLRTVELAANDGGGERPWTFKINGLRKFIRGANWVPADSFPGRVDRERYFALLRMAKDAGINMLRVWGGGLREKKAFYEICDELGIMVWQEFPFACGHAFPYPKTGEFRRTAESEIKGIVRATHAHPSVVFYCGGNEISYARNRELFDRIAEITRKEGGDRPFSPHSPAAGEAHNWFVHHSLANIAEYRAEETCFLSEFGMQAPPDVESLRRFMPENRLWPVRPVLPYSLSEAVSLGPSFWDKLPALTLDHRTVESTRMWYHHNAQLYKMFRYAKIRGFHDLETFVAASQEAQAAGLQVAVEHIRRRRYRSSGVMFWQLNEPWPAVCWSVIDYYLRPKRAYWKIAAVMAPALVSLDYIYKRYRPGDEFRAEAWVINDMHRPLEGARLTVSLVTDAGRVELAARDLGRVEPDSLTSVGEVAATLPETVAMRVECRLEAGREVFDNEYDLTFHDATPTPKAIKAAHKFMTEFMWK